MLTIRRTWFQLLYRRQLRRRGLIAVPVDRYDQLCADAAAVLVAQIEAELGIAPEAGS